MPKRVIAKWGGRVLKKGLQNIQVLNKPVKKVKKLAKKKPIKKTTKKTKK